MYERASILLLVNITDVMEPVVEDWGKKMNHVSLSVRMSVSVTDVVLVVVYYDTLYKINLLILVSQRPL